MLELVELMPIAQCQRSRLYAIGVLRAMAPRKLGVPFGSTPKEPPGKPDIWRVSGNRPGPASSDWQKAKPETVKRKKQASARMDVIMRKAADP
ncbi:MAG: hypothetical protein QOJ65_1708 [Fimbriimonadaceae bacterium]|nr:hypothetical protein [Fimbriimonadaceae bacterium]